MKKFKYERLALLAYNYGIKKTVTVRNKPMNG